VLLWIRPLLSGIMAPVARRLLPIAAALQQGACSEVLGWSGEMSGLDFSQLGQLEVSALSVAYASEVAEAIGVDAGNVADLNGKRYRVSLAPAASKGDSDADESSDDSVETSVTTTSRSTSTTAVVRTQPTQGPPQTMPDGLVRPLRGITYAPLPCTEEACGKHGLPSTDFLQAGYQAQWGLEGRDDLGVMAKLGANVVRTYHALGLKVHKDHSAFLDYAQSLGLQVLPGFHTQLANEPTECPDFDCFETWKDATLHGFKTGFKKGDEWHPAIGALTLLNEPDYFEGAPKCNGRGQACGLKAALSALDGVLAAERELGITNVNRVKLTVAWSFGLRESIDGKVSGPGIYGFQNIVAGIQDPSLAGYTPRSSAEDLAEAFRSRWVHCVNTQSPWDFVRENIESAYEQFLPTPWFIGEYGASQQPEAIIRNDLMDMQREAEAGGAFMGVAFHQFQTAYWKGGSGMSFGIFALQEEKVTETAWISDRVANVWRAWPVHCLTSELPFEGAMGRRAQAVASAWGGVVDVSSYLCSPQRRLEETHGLATSLSCNVRLVPGMSVASSQAALTGGDFAKRLVQRTVRVLGADSPAVRGALDLDNFEFVVKPASDAGEAEDRNFLSMYMVPALVGILACTGTSLCIALYFFAKTRKGTPTREPKDAASGVAAV